MHRFDMILTRIAANLVNSIQLTGPFIRDEEEYDGLQYLEISRNLNIVTPEFLQVAFTDMDLDEDDKTGSYDIIVKMDGDDDFIDFTPVSINNIKLEGQNQDKIKNAIKLTDDEIYEWKKKIDEYNDETKYGL